jgi:hypothetical protein
MMEPVQTTAAGACPPHHWLIGNEMTDQGTVERWSCHRCGAVRERSLSRRRPLLEADKRYVAAEGDSIATFLGQSGERVA